MIRRVEDSGRKAEIAKQILTRLPAWFGMPDNTGEYISEARKLRLWAAFEGEEPIGFITRKDTAVFTAEVHCMGVLPGYHRRGIGEKLMKTLEDDCEKDGMKLLQVKTVDEGHYPDSYDKTVAFYEKMGFIRLEVFPEMWDPRNPCLVLVKALNQ